MRVVGRRLRRGVAAAEPARPEIGDGRDGVLHHGSELVADGEGELGLEPRQFFQSRHALGALPRILRAHRLIARRLLEVHAQRARSRHEIRLESFPRRVQVFPREGLVRLERHRSLGRERSAVVGASRQQQLARVQVAVKLLVRGEVPGIRQREHRVDVLEHDVVGFVEELRGGRRGVRSRSARHRSSLANPAARVHHANLRDATRRIDRRDVHLLADASGALTIAEVEIQQRAFLRSTVHLPGLLQKRRRRLRERRRQSRVGQSLHARHPLGGEHRVDIADEIHPIDQRVIPRRRLGLVPKRRRLSKPRAKRGGILGVEDEV